VWRMPGLELFALWRECVRRQADSELTIAQFCAHKHLSAAPFRTWKRRLQLIDLADRSPAVAAPVLPHLKMECRAGWVIINTTALLVGLWGNAAGQIRQEDPHSL
jgi:hypothetical protein